MADVLTSATLNAKSPHLSVENPLCHQEADGSFASRHGIVSSGIERVAAADALGDNPVTLQEAVLLTHAIVGLFLGKWFLDLLWSPVRKSFFLHE